MTGETMDQTSPFTCDMLALPPAERQHHVDAIDTVFGSVQAVRELADGYAFRLPGDEASLVQAASFVAKERLCCPFFGFEIEVEPEGGAVWLALTGREGVKPFIRAEIGGALGDSVAGRAGFR